MELSNRIKELRTEKGWSQEVLAQHVYVSRQTISNWETERSYPDVHSLLILSDLFGVSIDELIKGDVDTMKEKITKNDGKEMKKLYNLAGIETLAGLASAVLASVLDIEALRLLFAVLTGMFLTADFTTFHKMGQMQAEHDVQTYREVIAFMNGETLDEIEKAAEFEKRKVLKKKRIVALFLVLGIGLTIEIIVFSVLLLINRGYII
ncbi:MAG: helix-turn-helix transcriptional regulator [Ruminococcus sp.]|jgi:transcriptional regulator with XRE-family HTH domain|uniref:helix-turn-helix transcriptional regulator n=1 Tax=Ruminococcus sp. TaxID=41978 RepID=UPI001B1E234C|nr:helix-turn-helix transcriptional regulator [Ruminococcus sp.]MBO7475200.1 helix-turn-helix transcriptional regulator [Ruminococcus sp.]